MVDELQLGDLAIEVVHKDIKNVHLSVHPPAGRVRIAAPRHLTIDAIRAFAIGKLTWIRQQQQKLLDQQRETPREYLHRESHYVWGRRCLLEILEQDAAASVDWRHHRLTLTVRPGIGTLYEHSLGGTRWRLKSPAWHARRSDPPQSVLTEPRFASGSR